MQSLIDKVKAAKLIGLDTETTGVSPLIDEMVGISMAFNTEESYYIPFMHPMHETIN